MLHWFADLMNVTEEVTIHRPNVSTLLSSAFIRGDLNAATRGPFIWSLISGLFRLVCVGFWFLWFVLFWLKTKKWNESVRRSLSFFSLLRTYSNFLWNAFLFDQSNFLETKLCFITLGRSCYMCFRRLKQRTRKKKRFKQLLFVYYW